MEDKHIYCEFEEYFYEILGDDFMEENTITIVSGQKTNEKTTTYITLLAFIAVFSR